MKKCQTCGNINADDAIFCNKCGHKFDTGANTESERQDSNATGSSYQNGPQGNYYRYDGSQNYYDQAYKFDNNAYYQYNDAFHSDMYGKSRGVTALLAIFLGCFGVHYFYLGKPAGGVICILLSFLTCGLWNIITLAQGITLFCADNAYFDRKFVFNRATFPVF